MPIHGFRAEAYDRDKIPFFQDMIHVPASIAKLILTEKGKLDPYLEMAVDEAVIAGVNYFAPGAGEVLRIVPGAAKAIVDV